MRDRVRADNGDSSSEQIRFEELVSSGYRVEVKSDDLELILGASKHDLDQEVEQEGKIGVSTGLAYRGSGNGGILRSSCFSLYHALPSSD